MALTYIKHDDVWLTPQTVPDMVQTLNKYLWSE